MAWYSKKILIENGQIFEKNWLSIEETTPHPRLIGSHRSVTTSGVRWESKQNYLQLKSIKKIVTRPKKLRISLTFKQEGNYLKESLIFFPALLMFIS